MHQLGDSCGQSYWEGWSQVDSFIHRSSGWLAISYRSMRDDSCHPAGQPMLLHMRVVTWFPGAAKQ